MFHAGTGQENFFVGGVRPGKAAHGLPVKIIKYRPGTSEYFFKNLLDPAKRVSSPTNQT